MKVLKNRFRDWKIWLLLLCSACASGQTLPSLNGIRITSSNVDLVTGQRELTFINDSSADITAYQVASLNVHPDGSTSRSTMPKELLNPEWQSQLKHRPFLPQTPPTGGVIHPGESVTVRWSEQGGDTPSTAYSRSFIGIDLVIYSDGTGESLDPFQLHASIGGRQRLADEYATIAEIGRKVLAESDGTNALANMRDSLTAAERSGSLKWSRASEFTRVLQPQTEEQFGGSLIESIAREHRMKCGAKQREILTDFIADQEEIAAAWSKAAEINTANQREAAK